RRTAILVVMFCVDEQPPVARIELIDSSCEPVTAAFQRSQQICGIEMRIDAARSRAHSGSAFHPLRRDRGRTVMPLRAGDIEARVPGVLIPMQLAIAAVVEMCELDIEAFGNRVANARRVAGPTVEIPLEGHSPVFALM